ncbi:MAG: S8/S53 family peptidase [Pseudomonadota bacterium]
MPGFIKDFRPDLPRPRYDHAMMRLTRTESRVLIAQIDSGIAPHPVFGDDFPANIMIDAGRNFFDPGGAFDDKPLTDLSRSGGAVADFIEYPDHGVKTLSVLLGDNDRIRGVTPGAKIVPYRVSNGPLFRSDDGPRMAAEETAKIGEAIDHALSLPVPPRVITISMGNPGHMGFWEMIRHFFGGTAGLARSTKQAINRAYDAGVIVVCAAGQITDTIVEPAIYPRTIAVGGIDQDGGDIAHYPTEGYNIPERVDIWAQAQRINRAAFDLDATPPTPVYAEDFDTGDPSGTSYATPQVAGAAALWVATYQETLEIGAFADQPWRVVEAFRTALRASARRRPATLPGRSPAQVHILDIERLLSQDPQVPADSARKAEVS